MMTSDLLTLESIERELTTHRAFGESAYIHNQMGCAFERRLNLLASDIPAAARLLTALSRARPYARYRTRGDTVLRAAIQHARVQLATGQPYGLPLSDCEEVFRVAACHLESGIEEGPLRAATTLALTLGTDGCDSRIWSGDTLDGLFERSFRFLVHDIYGQPPHCPDARDIEGLTRGARLLEELLPELARSVMSHAHMIVLFPNSGQWQGRNSSSEFRIAGTIFLNQVFLDNPWWVAEHLLHEALHHKLYDFRHGHSLLESDFSRVGAPRVRSLWNQPRTRNDWDAHRAIAAFHVYAHLGLFGLLAEQRGPELERLHGPIRGIVGSRTSLDRAHYLGEQLMAVCANELGLAGKHMVDWLFAVLDSFDPAPPPEGSFLHLLLDRYRKEGKRVDRILQEARHAGAGQSSSEDRARSGDVAELLEEEIRTTRHILSTIGEAGALLRFDNNLAQLSEADPSHRFCAVRDLISQSLLDSSSDGYTLSPPAPFAPSADERVREMVESSSQILSRLFP